MNRHLTTDWAPRMLSVLRIVAGLIFFAHGTQKLLGFPASEFSPEFPSLPWIAGALELVGGPFLILGLFTRPVAFILSGQMAVAYWMAHAPQSPFPVLNGGDSAILYCFVFLYLVFAGPGPWSLDVVLGREVASPTWPSDERRVQSYHLVAQACCGRTLAWAAVCCKWQEQV